MVLAPTRFQALWTPCCKDSLSLPPRIIDPSVLVNPLGNYFFTGISSILIVALGWAITDLIVEPRLNRTTPIDDDAEGSPQMDTVDPVERKGFIWSTLTLVAGLVVLVLVLLPADSPMRDASGSLNSFSAPIMQSIVPLIFLLFLIPGVVFGYVTGKFRNSKDYGRRHDQVDERDVILHRYGVFLFAVCLCIRSIKHRRTAGLERRCPSEGSCDAGRRNDRWNHLPDSVCEPVCRLCLGQVGAPRSNLCADAHAGRASLLS